MMKIFRNLSRVLKISSAIAQGQKVSEYQIAWAYADLMLPELIEALKSGVSRSDAITALAVATQVKRSVACDVLCKKPSAPMAWELVERAGPESSALR